MRPSARLRKRCGPTPRLTEVLETDEQDPQQERAAPTRTPGAERTAGSAPQAEASAQHADSGLDHRRGGRGDFVGSVGGYQAETRRGLFDPGTGPYRRWTTPS